MQALEHAGERLLRGILRILPLPQHPKAETKNLPAKSLDQGHHHPLIASQSTPDQAAQFLPGRLFLPIGHGVLIRRKLILAKSSSGFTRHNPESPGQGIGAGDRTIPILTEAAIFGKNVESD
jgi:hypothetical protein